jgi:AI-2E family transporter
VVALVTIFVLTFLMVLQGPKLLAGWTAALPERQQERVRRVAADAAKAVTGYVTGNLLVSVIAGAVTYVVLWVMGVPDRGVVALFVGFADLIPLVGATLGAVVAVAVAALHSLPAALVVLVVFVAYQQLENHVLQPVIMARTVALSALSVLVSILVGVELFGFLGALLAIPVAGVLHVVARDLYDGYRGRPKPEPTTGTDEVPVSQPRPPEPGEQHPTPRTSPPPRTGDLIGASRRDASTGRYCLAGLASAIRATPRRGPLAKERTGSSWEPTTRRGTRPKSSRGRPRKGSAGPATTRNCKPKAKPTRPKATSSKPARRSRTPSSADQPHPRVSLVRSRPRVECRTNLEWEERGH